MCCLRTLKQKKDTIPYLFGPPLPNIARYDSTLVSPDTAKQDTLLLDRCILEEKVEQMDRRHEEEVVRLQVEFQLERSDLRKTIREVSNPRLLTALE